MALSGVMKSLSQLRFGIGPAAIGNGSGSASLAGDEAKSRYSELPLPGPKNVVGIEKECCMVTITNLKKP